MKSNPLKPQFGWFNTMYFSYLIVKKSAFLLLPNDLIADHGDDEHAPGQVCGQHQVPTGREVMEARWDVMGCWGVAMAKDQRITGI